MQLEIYRTLWGTDANYAETAKESREAGFDGLETRVPERIDLALQLKSALKDYKLKLIAEISTAGNYSLSDRNATVEEHINSLERLLDISINLHPEFINCMGGSDSWDDAQNTEFFERCLEIENRYKITICHETHRGRSLFNPWITRRMVETFPELNLTCDFSHWCVVCERLLDREGDALELIAKHAHHIHARVGYAEGPQVPHPAAPEYEKELAAHQNWWQLIWEAQFKKGYTLTTLNPEFGVDGYLHELPFTQVPVANLWNIQQWMVTKEREHFSKFAMKNDSIVRDM